MSFHKSDIIQAIGRFELFEYLQSVGVIFQVKSEGGYYYCKCFNCGKTKMFIHAASTDKHRGFWRCWSCGNKGDLFDLVAQHDQVSRKEAFLKIVGSGGETFYDVEDGPLKSELNRWASNTVIKLNDAISLPSNFVPLSQLGPSNPGYQYALSRQITPELMIKFDVRYNSMMHRIIFPIKFRRKIVGWQARAIHPSIQPKLLSSQGIKKTQLLYNFDNVEFGRSIMIVEGPIDAINAHEYNAVALLGKDMSSIQFKLLLRMPNLQIVYVALDPDAASYATKLATKLSEIWDVHIVRLPVNKDIGDCTKDELLYYHKTANHYNGIGGML